MRSLDAPLHVCGADTLAPWRSERAAKLARFPGSFVILPHNFLDLVEFNQLVSLTAPRPLPPLAELTPHRRSMMVATPAASSPSVTPPCSQVSPKGDRAPKRTAPLRTGQRLRRNPLRDAGRVGMRLEPDFAVATFGVGRGLEGDCAGRQLLRALRLALDSSETTTRQQTFLPLADAPVSV